MGSGKRDENGLVGLVLTIVIVWALIAVIMLTRTLVAAQQIDTTVKGIEGSVKSANSHLNTGCDTTKANGCPTDALPVLSQTEVIAAQINDAAKPLTGEAAQIITAAASINTTASAILANASAINGTVHAINSSATSIGASVNGIHSSLDGVNADVSNVQQAVAGINTRVNGINNTVLGIKSDTGAINGLAGGILVQAKGICADKLAVISIQLAPIC